MNAGILGFVRITTEPWISDPTALVRYAGGDGGDGGCGGDGGGDGSGGDPGCGDPGCTACGVADNGCVDASCCVAPGSCDAMCVSCSTPV